MKKAYVIDGNSLLFRAFYATYRGDENAILRTKSGIPTNALFAFANMMNKILGSLKKEDALFVAFDTGRATFRHLEDEEYKANRKPCPPLLKEQMPIVRDFLKSLNIFTYEKEGYEADDLAGTYAKKAAKEGYEVIVYTSDRDYLQLIDDNITIHILKTGMSNIAIMDEKAMLNEYGIKPLQIIDYKGLRGDASDNLPGIPGVGDKTAIKLIQDYGSFEKIMEIAPTLKSKVGESLVNNRKMGELSYRLARIDINVELPFEIKDTIYDGYDFNNISDFANKFELKQFMNKLPSNWVLNTSESEELNYVELTSLKDIDCLEGISIALDKDEGNYNDAIVYGLALYNGKENYYIKIDDFKNDEILKSVLEDERIDKYCYDFKALKVIFNHLGIDLKGLKFDILLASYLIDSTLEIKSTSILRHFGYDISVEKELSLFDNSNPLQAVKLAYYVKKVSNKVISELDKLECLKLYQNVELPLCNVLAEMEIEGFPLDVNTLEEFGASFKEELSKSEKKIYELAGEMFNIDSPKQVGEILFNKLNLPASNKKLSTSVDVLKTLVDYHPIVNEILRYRKYAKLMSTYVTGLASHVREDGKIHAIFNQALTQTGRLSSSEPNLQNISIRDEEGKMIRKAFYYKDENYSILSLDYSQIELRVLASLSGSKALQDVFKNKEDIHASTAKAVFHIDNPTSEQRRRAKAVNFGIIYGISDWGLSEQIGVSPKEAKQIINAFYDAYPEIGQYFQKVVNDANKNLYATTLLGRRRYLHELNDANYQVREFARRAAMNAPIQGTAADLIKIAMIKVSNALKEHHLKTKLVLQIHDELLFKVPNDEKEIVYPLIKDIMEHAMELDVELEVDGGYGRTWYDAK